MKKILISTAAMILTISYAQGDTRLTAANEFNISRLVRDSSKASFINKSYQKADRNKSDPFLSSDSEAEYRDGNKFADVSLSDKEHEKVDEPTKVNLWSKFKRIWSKKKSRNKKSCAVDRNKPMAVRSYQERNRMKKVRIQKERSIEKIPRVLNLNVNLDDLMEDARNDLKNRGNMRKSNLNKSPSQQWTKGNIQKKRVGYGAVY